MTVYPNANQIQKLITQAQRIVVIQADNPDADSLASSLALESILEEIGKEVVLYCGVTIPSYLHYLQGWGRVQAELPAHFDLSIIVDTSALTLLESLTKLNAHRLLANKACLIIDHHSGSSTIDYATEVLNVPAAVSTGEVIYELANQLNWQLNHEARELITVSIFSDSLGLISQGTTARSIHIVAELVEQGVDLAKLDNERRSMGRKSPELLTYKGQLLQRVEFHDDDQIATVDIPWEEIERFSHLYNPSMLVLDDMRQVEKVKLAIAFKQYPGNKVTAKIRTNYGTRIAAKLAEHFGGGGHEYASGFKVQKEVAFSKTKKECIQLASELLRAPSESHL